MRSRLITLAFAILGLQGMWPCCAQVLTANGLDRISTALAGKPLPLRGYPWQNAIGYRMIKGHLQPIVRRNELTSFSLVQVTEKRGYLELHGERTLYVRNGTTQAISPVSTSIPTVLVVYLPDLPDVATLPDRLLSDLFFSSIDEAVAAVPDWQKPCVPGTSVEDGVLQTPSTCRAKMDTSDPTPPKLIKQVDVVIPRSVKVKGLGKWDVLVALRVDAKGIPEDVHVIVPSYVAGSQHEALDERAAEDLDGNAVAAVKWYRFQPALDGSVPVPYQLNVAIDFTIIDRP